MCGSYRWPSNRVPNVKTNVRNGTLADAAAGFHKIIPVGFGWFVIPDSSMSSETWLVEDIEQSKTHIKNTPFQQYELRQGHHRCQVVAPGAKSHQCILEHQNILKLCAAVLKAGSHTSEADMSTYPGCLLQDCSHALDSTIAALNPELELSDSATPDRPQDHGYQKRSTQGRSSEQKRNRGFEQASESRFYLAPPYHARAVDLLDDANSPHYACNRSGTQPHCKCWLSTQKCVRNTCRFLEDPEGETRCFEARRNKKKVPRECELCIPRNQTLLERHCCRLEKIETRILSIIVPVLLALGGLVIFGAIVKDALRKRRSRRLEKQRQQRRKAREAATRTARSGGATDGACDGGTDILDDSRCLPHGKCEGGSVANVDVEGNPGHCKLPSRRFWARFSTRQRNSDSPDVMDPRCLKSATENSHRGSQRTSARARVPVMPPANPARHPIVRQASRSSGVNVRDSGEELSALHERRPSATSRDSQPMDVRIYPDLPTSISATRTTPLRSVRWEGGDEITPAPPLAEKTPDEPMSSWTHPLYVR